MDVRTLHPDRLTKRLFRRWRVPRWLQRSVQALLVLAAWYGLISSLVGIASTARWIIDLAGGVYRFAVKHAPDLVIVLDAIQWGLEAWRTITRPLYEFLFGWWPIAVPAQAVDVLIIGAVLLSAYLRGWLATRAERRFAKAVSPYLTKDGRRAVLLRIYASLEMFRRADNESDKGRATAVGDRAESDLVAALDDLTEGADTSLESDMVIDEVLSQTPDEVKEMMWYAANVEDVERGIRRKLLMRASIVALVLAAIVVVDAIYALTR